MGPITVKSVIEKALREITALSEGEQATAHMIQDGLETLNALLAQWSVEGLMVPYMHRESFPGSTSKASYTVRPGGDVDIASPVSVAAVSFRIGNLVQPLRPVENTEYMAARWLGDVGQPKWFYYERTQDGGVLHFDTAPYEGGFDMWMELPLLPAQHLTENMALPDYYIRAIVSNLAIDLCPEYGKEPSGALTYKAGTAKSVIESYNSTPPPELSLRDMPMVGRRSTLPLR